MNIRGLNRLLRLATILDTADEKHVAAGEPRYCQRSYAFVCGSPGCALGHWAWANPKRWRQSENGNSPSSLVSGRAGIYAAEKEFGLSRQRALNIFGIDGCGQARTAKDAARYIRRQARRWLRALEAA